MDSRITGILAIVIASILWGSTGVSASFAPNVNALAIGACALGLGGLSQALFAIREIPKQIPLIRQHLGILILGAVCICIYPLAFYGSMRLINVTIGTVISIGCAPIFAALIEAIAERQRIDMRWVIATAIGIIGIALLSFSRQQITTNTTHEILGIVLTLVAGATYALYTWSAKALMRHQVTPKAAMGSVFGLGGLLLLPILFWQGSTFLDSWQNMAVGAYMVCIPMFIGYVCFGYGLAHVSTSLATTITLLEPVSAAILANIIIHEYIAPLGWFGIACVFLCLIIMTLPRHKNM